MTEEELGFIPQKAVRWLAPRVLISTGIKSVVAGIFGSYSDKRELQGSLPALTHRHDAGEELWLDYVADLGDGFDATYSVASLLARDDLVLDGESLPRGQVLIMGGDEVYPVGSARGYEDRTKGVYRAAMPSPPDDPPALFALPGNHDWYDGLTAFLRVFTQRRAVGGWTTEQTRSYFAIELPQRWWLLAIDTQFDDYVDSPQLEYFRKVSAELREGDAVILCTSTPAWVPAGSGGESKGYDTFEFFNREIVRPSGATIRLRLSGDTHHYARYAEHDGTSQLMTCGIGGAYLAATHLLPETLVLPPARSRVRHPEQATRYDLVQRWPERMDSEKLAAGVFGLPWRNPGFWTLTGVFQMAMSLAVLYGLATTVSVNGRGFFGLVASWVPAAIVAGVLIMGGMAFARLELPQSRGVNRLAGLAHAALHIGLSTGWAWVLLALYRDVLPHGLARDWTIFLLVLIGTPVVIGFVDAELVAFYLLVVSRFGINLNEVFAAQSIEDRKGFLRMHITRDGDLKIYPVKLTTVGRDWELNASGAPRDPWLKPKVALQPELIEPAIVIPRVSAPSTES